MPSISKKSLILTALYFIVWCLGPLFWSDTGNWYGLPVWFWISCLLAPLGLIILVIADSVVTNHD